MSSPSLPRVQPSSSGSVPKFAGPVLSGIGSAAKKAEAVRGAIETGTNFFQNVKKETEKGKPLPKVVTCEALGTFVQEGSGKAIQTGVIGVASALAVNEPWILPPLAPTLLDTWQKADATASLLGNKARSTCYHLLGGDEKTPINQSTTPEKKGSK